MHKLKNLLSYRITISR